MNITFLIGNGFDLNLGLKTSYKDFYKYYTSKVSNDLIADSVKDNYELWADLEIGLGEFAKELDETQVSDFLNSKAKLENCLCEYLKKEMDKFRITNTQELITEFTKKITGFYKELNLRERNNYKSYIESYIESINYTFISFNYTDSLDRIINKLGETKSSFSVHTARNNNIKDKISTPLHIHGTVDSELILGLDDATQVKNDKLKDNFALIPYIVKPTLNEELGQLKIEQAKQIIDNSRYVCIFGMSIGDTDNLWWRYIIEWLKRDKQNRLILYVYDGTIVQASGQEKLRLANKNRNRFIKKNKKLPESEKSELMKQISFIQNSDVFCFKSIKIERYKNEQDENAEQG